MVYYYNPDVSIIVRHGQSTLYSNIAHRHAQSSIFLSAVFLDITNYICKYHRRDPWNYYVKIMYMGRKNLVRLCRWFKLYITWPICVSPTNHKRPQADTTDDHMIQQPLKCWIYITMKFVYSNIVQRETILFDMWVMIDHVFSINTLRWNIYVNKPAIPNMAYEIDTTKLVWSWIKITMSVTATSHYNKD